MQRRLLILTAVAALAAITVAGCSTSDASLTTVSPEEAASVIADDASAIVVDIRTPEEFAEGIIEGAVNVDFYASDFADQLDALDKDASYVVYCRSGNRSDQAMDVFADLGFTDVTEIDGGIVAWYGQGLPVVLP